MLTNTKKNGGIMGLDMSLYRVPKTDTMEDTDTQVLESHGISNYWAGDYEVAYWRKANHIHKWFVNNVQEGIDDCGVYYVSEGKLAELRKTCLNVISGKESPESHLSTADGFFFGSTEYDDYYFYDCDKTITLLDSILGETDWYTQRIIYSSSW
jgi:hypothetical protein